MSAPISSNVSGTGTPLNFTSGQAPELQGNPVLTKQTNQKEKNLPLETLGYQVCLVFADFHGKNLQIQTYSRNSCEWSRSHGRLDTAWGTEP